MDIAKWMSEPLEGGTEVLRLENDVPRSFRVDKMWALLHLDIGRRAAEGVVQLGEKAQRAVDERRHRAPEIRIGRRHHDLVVRGLTVRSECILLRNKDAAVRELGRTYASETLDLS